MRVRSAPAGIVAFGVACASVTPLACADPVHDAQVQALGDEAPGIPAGPFHRAGQPCLACHGSSGPASLQLSIGGTVYATQGQNAPADNATVTMTDVAGMTWNAPTNQVGNFFVTAREWQPTYPIGLISVTRRGTTGQMFTNIGRDGSCADCHYDPSGKTSPGRIYIAVSSSRPADGGTP
jgi:hypothetical protein